jgi:citrate synthase
MGYPLNYYDNTKGYVENFMSLMFETPENTTKQNLIALSMP